MPLIRCMDGPACVLCAHRLGSRRPWAARTIPRATPTGGNQSRCHREGRRNRLTSSASRRVRRRWCDCLMPRRSEDYRQLPPPATAVDLLTWGEGTDHAAYTLVGNDGAMSILYQMIGDPAGFAALWPEACRGYRRTLINDVSGSASHSWLTANSDLVWHAKPLAMWLPLSARTDLTHVARWHISVTSTASKSSVSSYQSSVTLSGCPAKFFSGFCAGLRSVPPAAIQPLRQVSDETHHHLDAILWRGNSIKNFKPVVRHHPAQ